MSARPDRETIQKLFIRVCRDSGFKLSADRAAVLTADIAGCHALDVWIALPSLDVMSDIAAGTHPAAPATPSGVKSHE